ncbi:ABC transporter permease [Achromobacter agilis]|uniref:Glutathione transport system permease protein GsiD n=1 Tax=Achromobacter agilis TaxID=1353888 RepID=A0A446CJB3_9BURK|nr:ABC transporter permease [Achromobacter agilis]SSW67863.1 Glutathione transport system permease protein GsiD [Achromobacter agilis]
MPAPPPSLPNAAATRRPRPRQGAVWRLLTNPGAVAGAVLLLLILLAAATAPWSFPQDPLDMVGPPILWPGQDPAFWLGTDTMGRDIAAGLAHGAQVSLTVGVTAALLSLAIGIAVGATAGYAGGWADVVLMRITELLQTIPSFLLVVVIVAIGRPSVPVIALSIGVASWPVVARLVRAEFRTLREAEFVQAARSSGFGHFRIAFLEILPNALPPVIVTTSVLVANAILIESALSFMNMGDPNAVSWGSMIGDAREMLRTAWYLAALPGLSIVLTVLSLNLLGDALNDAFNPRLAA